MNEATREVCGALEKLAKKLQFLSKREYGVPVTPNDAEVLEILDLVWYKRNPNNIIAAFEVDCSGYAQQAKKNILNLIHFYKIQSKKPRMLTVVISNQDPGYTSEYVRRANLMYQKLVKAFEIWGNARDALGKLNFWTYRNKRFCSFYFTENEKLVEQRIRTHDLEKRLKTKAQEKRAHLQLIR